MKRIRGLALLIAVFYLIGCENKPEIQTEQKKDSLTIAGSPVVASIKNDTSAKDGDVSLKNENQTYTEAYNKAIKLWEIPFEELKIKTSFGNAHVIVCGKANGQPLVLLHGMNASSTMWYPNIKSLSEHYKIYAIDFLMEPGKSICEQNISKTSQIVDWYYEIFDALKLKKFSILGASRGGWLAVNIALRSHSRINKIALLSPAQTFIWIKPGPKIMFNLAYSVFPKRKQLRSVLETMTFDVDKINQIYINQYYLATKASSIDNCFFDMTPFTDKELRSLKMPVLLLIGDNDIINNSKSLEKAKRLIPDLKTGTIKNAGHFLSIDQSEIVNKEIIAFLK